MTPTLAHLLQRFLGHHLPIHRGLAVNTVLAYRDTLKLLLCYAADRLKKPVDKLLVEDLDELLVLAFLEHLEKQRNCSARTRNVRLAAIRTFFGFAAREEPALLVQAQIVRTIPLKRTSYATIGYLEETEMQALLDAVDLRSRTGIRDRALLLLLYNTGARVSEIAALNRQDLQLEPERTVLLRGKGRKQRLAPLWKSTAHRLKRWLAAHPGSPTLPLFTN
jgi:site-specific recombinase XerD